MNLSYIWLGVMIAFAALEGITVALVSLWFACGALAALLVSLFTGNIWVQLFVFGLVSLVSLLLVRPLAQGLVNRSEKVKVNADRVIGEEGIVVEAIRNLDAVGQVKVGGQVWTARSEFEGEIPVGATVRVLRIEGVKLYVEPMQEN